MLILFLIFSSFVFGLATGLKYILCVCFQTLRKKQQKYNVCGYLLDECCEPSLPPISNQLAPLSHALDRSYFSHNWIATKFWKHLRESFLAMLVAQHPTPVSQSNVIQCEIVREAFL